MCISRKVPTQTNTGSVVLLQRNAKFQVLKIKRRSFIPDYPKENEDYRNKHVTCNLQPFLGVSLLFVLERSWVYTSERPGSLFFLGLNDKCGYSTLKTTHARFFQHTTRTHTIVRRHISWPAKGSFTKSLSVNNSRQRDSLYGNAARILRTYDSLVQSSNNRGLTPTRSKIHHSFAS